ncbi:MAG TPA: hypothetical protein VJ869_12290 [Sphaerochaeta sp.]|nr:hypothetical protein [Sphaerochaeta sp.]
MGKAVQDKQYRKAKTDMFLEVLTKHGPLVHEFSPDLWNALEDYGTVTSKEDVRFTFKN